MVSRAFELLTDIELTYMEKLLGESLSKEIDENKNWTNENGYEKPNQKTRMILACLNAVKSQRQYVKTMSVKW
tara:strand:+ start:190 stop:408 length:219 start_codon:yes stop_codon:yes gene_type:complete